MHKNNIVWIVYVLRIMSFVFCMMVRELYFVLSVNCIVYYA